MKRYLFALALCAPAAALAQNLTQRQAVAACELFIKKTLHDPDSASMVDAPAVILKANRALVMQNARATNGFGGKRVHEFMCLLELKDGRITAHFVGTQSRVTDETRRLVRNWKLLP